LPFTASMPAVVPVAKYLPAAMTVFCTAAPDAEQAERLHQSGPGERERRRVAGTHYRQEVRKDDAPSAGDDGPTAGASRIVLLCYHGEMRKGLP
jgi:hypothetical protein